MNRKNVKYKKNLKRLVKGRMDKQHQNKCIQTTKQVKFALYSYAKKLKLSIPFNQFHIIFDKIIDRYLLIQILNW